MWRRSLFIVARCNSLLQGSNAVWQRTRDEKFDQERSYSRNGFRGLISRRRFCSTYFLYFIYSSGKLVCPSRATESLFFSRIRADARPPSGKRARVSRWFLSQPALVNARTKDWLPQLCIAANCTRLQVCWPLFRRSIHRPYCNTVAELHAIGHLAENVCPVIAVYSQWKDPDFTGARFHWFAEITFR